MAGFDPFFSECCTFHWIYTNFVILLFLDLALREILKMIHSAYQFVLVASTMEAELVSCFEATTQANCSS